MAFYRWPECIDLITNSNRCIYKKELVTIIFGKLNLEICINATRTEDITRTLLYAMTHHTQLDALLSCPSSGVSLCNTSQPLVPVSEASSAGRGQVRWSDCRAMWFSLWAVVIYELCCHIWAVFSFKFVHGCVGTCLHRLGRIVFLCVCVWKYMCVCVCLCVCACKYTCVCVCVCVQCWESSLSTWTSSVHSSQI